MAVHLIGRECSVTFTGEDTLVVASALREQVARSERTHGTVPKRLQDAFQSASVAAQGYAAERRSATSGFGSGAGTTEFRLPIGEAESALPADRPEWITATQAAQRLGVSDSYVRRLCRQRRLRARRPDIGADWRIDPEAVATWVPGRAT